MNKNLLLKIGIPVALIAAIAAITPKERYLELRDYLDQSKELFQGPPELIEKQAGDLEKEVISSIQEIAGSMIKNAEGEDSIQRIIDRYSEPSKFEMTSRQTYKDRDLIMYRLTDDKGKEMVFQYWGQEPEDGYTLSLAHDNFTMAYDTDTRIKLVVLRMPPDARHTTVYNASVAGVHEFYQKAQELMDSMDVEPLPLPKDIRIAGVTY